jgi:hypothetical protein
MRVTLILILIVNNICKGQEWQAELMGGVSGYNGDLTQRRVALKELRPALNFNIKYNSGDYVNVRIGIGYTQLAGNDKDNTRMDLKNRNLSFKSNIFEANVIGEVNLFDPEEYTSYPYILGGVGLFHFNPFTYDKDNRKTYLQPLSTEGEGLKEYPGRKKYSLVQFCLPVGAGWKWNINEQWNISYEFGIRILFTDYLDDVSRTYADLEVLVAEKGPKSAELAYRGAPPFVYVGEMRGNRSVNDVYFFNGVKISRSLGNLWKRN